jgi:hypothetical protein
MDVGFLEDNVDGSFKNSEVRVFGGIVETSLRKQPDNTRP